MAPKNKPLNIYLIHNTTRSPATKLQRMQLAGPEKSTKNLTLCGGALRILRGRSQPLAEPMLMKWLESLIDKQKKGLITVTLAGKVVDLSSLGGKPPAPPPAPAPKTTPAPPPAPEPEPEEEEEEEDPFAEEDEE